MDHSETEHAMTYARGTVCKIMKCAGPMLAQRKPNQMLACWVKPTEKGISVKTIERENLATLADQRGQWKSCDEILDHLDFKCCEAIEELASFSSTPFYTNLSSRGEGEARSANIT